MAASNKQSGRKSRRGKHQPTCHRVDTSSRLTPEEIALGVEDGPAWIPPGKTTYEGRYYFAYGKTKACIGMDGGYVDDLTVEDILSHRGDDFIQSLASQYVRLLRHAKMQYPANAKSIVVVRGGKEPNHVIVSFWLSPREPKCVLTFKDKRPVPEHGSIAYRWNANLDTGIALPYKNLPVWLREFWKHEPDMEPCTILTFKMEQPNYRFAPTVEAYFQPFADEAFDAASEWYWIAVRYPEELANDGVIGMAKIRKQDWIEKKTHRIEYHFESD